MALRLSNQSLADQLAAIRTELISLRASPSTQP